jgi:cytochrome P450
METIEYPNLLTNGIRWLYQPYRFLDEACARHGLTFRMSLPGAGTALVTGDPELIQQVIVNKHLVGGKGVNVMRALFGGDSLMMLDGEKHGLHRRLLTPTFQKESIERYDELTEQATLEAIDQIPFDKPFSMFKVLAGITQRVIVRIVFGELPPVRENEAVNLIHAYMTSFHSPLVLFLKPLHVNLGSWSPWGRITRNREALRRFIFGQMTNFRNTENTKYSLLAHLMEKGGMSEEDMITEIFGMLMFGHDTTSVAMAWTLAHIYSRPEVLKQVKESTSTSFLEVCIRESMRLSPVVVQLLRVADEDVQIGSYRIKKNEMVMPCLYLAHHNPQVFAKPDQFMPERFMNKEYPLNAFFPFGFGSRLCAGKPLAERQMPIILSAIIKSTNLMLASGYQPAPTRYMVFIAPRQGTQMIRKALA